MVRKNPETVVVSGFSEPISFSVRNVGAVVLNGFEKTNYKQPTFTHIFKPYQIGTLVFSKIIHPTTTRKAAIISQILVLLLITLPPFF